MISLASECYKPKSLTNLLEWLGYSPTVLRETARFLIWRFGEFSIDRQIAKFKRRQCQWRAISPNSKVIRYTVCSDCVPDLLAMSRIQLNYTNGDVHVHVHVPQAYLVY